MKYFISFVFTLFGIMAVSCFAEEQNIAPQNLIEQIYVDSKAATILTIEFKMLGFDEKGPISKIDMVKGKGVSMIYHCAPKCGNIAVSLEKVMSSLKQIKCTPPMLVARFYFSNEGTDNIAVYISESGKEIRFEDSCFSLEQSILPTLHSTFALF